MIDSSYGEKIKDIAFIVVEKMQIYWKKKIIKHTE
jgi:hypothetical protein